MQSFELDINQTRNSHLVPIIYHHHMSAHPMQKIFKQRPHNNRQQNTRCLIN